MSFPGPWIQPAPQEHSSTFLARTLRARSGGIARLEGYTDSYAAMYSWWLDGANPPWPEPSGIFDVDYPWLLARHELPVFDISSRVLTEWLPASLTEPADRWIHHGYFRIEDGQAEQASPLLGPFQTNVPSPVPDVPPEDAVGVELAGEDVTVSRRALVRLVVTGGGSQTVRVATPPTDRWTRQGPTVNRIPGNSGGVDLGPSSVWTDPQIASSPQWAWPGADESVSAVGDPAVVELDVPLDPVEDIAALAPATSLWWGGLAPAEGVSVQIESIRVYTKVRPRQYRWLYATPRGGGVWRLRQRQSLTGTDSWPLRQRQNGGATGSWPLRQRQRGV